MKIFVYRITGGKQGKKLEGFAVVAEQGLAVSMIAAMEGHPRAFGPFGEFQLVGEIDSIPDRPGVLFHEGTPCTGVTIPRHAACSDLCD